MASRIEWFFERPLRAFVLVAILIAIPVVVLSESSAQASRSRAQSDQLAAAGIVANRAAESLDARVRSLLIGLQAAAGDPDLVALALRAQSDPSAVDPLQQKLRNVRLALGPDVSRLSALSLVGIIGSSKGSARPSPGSLAPSTPPVGLRSSPPQVLSPAMTTSCCGAILVVRRSSTSSCPT